MLSQCKLLGFNLLHLSLPEKFPLLCLFFFLCFQVSSVSNFRRDTRGLRWLLVSAHLFNCVLGRKWCCKQISLACVGSVCSVRTTLDCSSSRQRVLPVSTLLGLQGALQGCCPKRAMCFMYFPGLNRSRSLVLREGTDSVGCAFCVLPRSEQLRRAGVWWAHCPRWAVHP